MPTKTLTIKVTVQGGSSLVNTAVMVSITGGAIGPVGAEPHYGDAAGYTTNGAGTLPAITVPRGATGTPTYTVKVYVANCAAFTTNRSGSSAGVNSTSSGNTAVTVVLTANACPFNPLP
jgi:hypothetical protein